MDILHAHKCCAIAFKVVRADTFALKLDSNKMSSAIVSRELHRYLCFFGNAARVLLNDLWSLSVCDTSVLHNLEIPNSN